MKLKNLKSASAAGFTLVELLVVIAIIGILASIAVPNMSRYMAKARIAKAIAEINNADLALTAMLTDGDKSRFRDFLTKSRRDWLNALARELRDQRELDNFENVVGLLITAQTFYNEFFYDLLRNGSNATIDINPSVRSRLEDGYMQMAKDPWDAQYRFWMGPQPQRNGPIFIRSYRVPRPSTYLHEDVTFYWTRRNRDFYNNDLPGQPPWDDLPGFPADRTKSVYIYSTGANQLVDAFIEIGRGYNELDWLGGGDDINNWDPQQGWFDAPK